MNKNLKKIIAAISLSTLTTVLVPSIYSTAAYAESLTVDTNDTVESAEKLGKYTDDTIKSEGDFQYIINADNTATIVNYTGNNSTVKFTDQINKGQSNQLNVTSIDANVFKNNNSNITSIVLPQYLKDGGVTEAVFEPCTKLQSIDSGNSTAYKSQDGILYSKGLDKLICFPQAKAVADFVVAPDVTTICSKALYNAKNIKTVTFADKVNDIADDAFIGMSNLTKIMVGPNNTSYLANDNGILFKADKSTSTLTLVKFPQNLAKESYTVQNYSTSGVTGVTLYTTKIGNYAFQGNTHLKSIQLKNESDTTDPKLKTASIGTSAFEGCTSLSEITVPSTITSISDFAFNKCSSLTNFQIDGATITLGKGIFNNCPSLKAIDMPNSTCEYKTLKGVLYKVTSQTTEATKDVPAVTTTTKELVKCPNNCETLDATKTYPVDADVNTIDEYAFQGNTNFKKIALVGSKVTEIKDHAFANCISLNQITWPESIQKLGENSFEGCSALQEINLPNTIVNVEKETFNECPNLQTLSLSPDLQSFNVTALNGCTSLSKLKINHVTDELGTYFYTKDNVLYMKNPTLSLNENKLDHATLIKYPIGLSAADFTIPDDVAIIGPDAFKGCTDKGALKKVDFNRPAKTISIADENSLKGLSTDTISPLYKNYYDATKDKAEPVVLFNDVFDKACELVDLFNRTTSSDEYFEISANQLNKVLVSNSAAIIIPSKNGAVDVTSIKKGSLDGVNVGTLTIPSSVTDMDINDINEKVKNKQIGKIEFAGNDRYVLASDGTLQDKTAQGGGNQGGGNQGGGNQGGGNQGGGNQNGDQGGTFDSKNLLGMFAASVVAGFGLLTSKKRKLNK